MYAIKQAILIKEKYPDTEVAIFYMDIRAFGKGYEDLYERAQLQRVRFIRGKVARIIQTPKKSLLVQAEDTLAGRVIRSEFDMVVLSTAIVPSADSDKLAEILSIRRGEDGFFKESHLKTCPVDTPVSGIYLAGVSQGPKDITDSITQALAAAQRVSSILSAAEVIIEPLIARVNEELCDGCRICELACSYNAIVMKKEKAQVIEGACKGCGECVAVCPKMAIHAFQRKINFISQHENYGG